MITANETRQIGLEDRHGTLEPGTEADLTIIESDPEMMSIKVSETRVAGQKKCG